MFFLVIDHLQLEADVPVPMESTCVCYSIWGACKYDARLVLAERWYDIAAPYGIQKCQAGLIP